MSDENVVFVGKKPTMSYVLAVLTQFNKGAKEVYIRARGKAISKAVSVAELVRNRFSPEIKLGEIKIATEEVKSEDGNVVRVSSIEIPLLK